MMWYFFTIYTAFRIILLKFRLTHTEEKNSAKKRTVVSNTAVYGTSKSLHGTVQLWIIMNIITACFIIILLTLHVILQQEPAWSGEELMSGLKHVRPGNGFVPDFPLSWKVDVNGAAQHPLYTYLKVRTNTCTL